MIGDIFESLKTLELTEEELEPIFVTPWTGKKHTEESKQKIGNSNRGRVHTEQSRKNMSEAHLGKPNPKSGASRKGIPLSEEHRKNKSLAMKKYWERRKNHD